MAGSFKMDFGAEDTPSPAASTAPAATSAPQPPSPQPAAAPAPKEEPPAPSSASVPPLSAMPPDQIHLATGGPQLSAFIQQGLKKSRFGAMAPNIAFDIRQQTKGADGKPLNLDKFSGRAKEVRPVEDWHIEQQVANMQSQGEKARS